MKESIDSLTEMVDSITATEIKPADYDGFFRFIDEESKQFEEEHGFNCFEINDQNMDLFFSGEDTPEETSSSDRSRWRLVKQFSNLPFRYFGLSRVFKNYGKRTHGTNDSSTTSNVPVYVAESYATPFVEYTVDSGNKFTKFALSIFPWTRYFTSNPSLALNSSPNSKDICKGPILVIADRSVGFGCFYNVTQKTGDTHHKNKNMCKGCSSVTSMLSEVRVLKQQQRCAERSILNQTDSQSFIEEIANRVSGLTRWEKEIALHFILHVALEGSVSDAWFPQLDPFEQETCFGRLQDHDLHCNYCGVKLEFFSFSGFPQFSYDRTVSLVVNGRGFGRRQNRFELPYDHEDQVTERCCLFCQKWMWHTNQEARKVDIRILIDSYDETLADSVIRDAMSTGNELDSIDEDRWKSIHYQQSKPRRDARKNSCRKVNYKRQNAIIKPKPADLEDIRDWAEDEMIAHMKTFGDICVVSGVSGRLMTLCCDRIYDDGHYCTEDTAPLWDRINNAKGALTAFSTRDSFVKFCQERNIKGNSLLEMMVEVLREPLKRLRRYQIAKVIEQCLISRIQNNSNSL